MTDTGQVVLKAEKAACRAFPDPKGDGIASGPKRNFQILSPLDFLAEFTQHIPPKSSHLIRYYGSYSNKARGMRRKAEAAVSAAAAQTEPSSPPTSRLISGLWPAREQEKGAPGPPWRPWGSFFPLNRLLLWWYNHDRR